MLNCAIHSKNVTTMNTSLPSSIINTCKTKISGYVRVTYRERDFLNTLITLFYANR